MTRSSENKVFSMRVVTRFHGIRYRTGLSVFKDVGFFHSHSAEINSTCEDALKIVPNLSPFQSIHYPN